MSSHGIFKNIFLLNTSFVIKWKTRKVYENWTQNLLFWLDNLFQDLTYLQSSNMIYLTHSMGNKFSSFSKCEQWYINSQQKFAFSLKAKV